jgi:hypothetical protein
MSRAFLQFISLAYSAGIYRVKNTDDALKDLSVCEIIDNMQTISKIYLKDANSKTQELISEIGPLPREIIRAFGLMHYYQ